MFRRCVQIPLWLLTLVALVIFTWNLGCEFASAAVVGQNAVTITPVRVMAASAEEIGGATIENLGPELAQELGFLPMMPGIVVTVVNPSSPAGVSGLLPGEVIVAVNNTPVQSVNQLKATIWRMAVTPVMFSVVRGGVAYIFTFPVW